MLIGHYAAAFAARTAVPELPLAAAFVAAQLVDVAWDVLILAGVEKARLAPGLPSNPLLLTFMPYTHSLAATVVFAVISVAVVRALRAFGGSTRAAVAFGAVVLSHWFFDLPVHRGDLPLAADSGPKLGFGLWNAPLAAVALELALLLLSLPLYLRRTKEDPRTIGAFAAALVGIQLVASFGPVPATLPAMAVSLLAMYVALAYAASRASRRASLSRATEPA